MAFKFNKYDYENLFWNSEIENMLKWYTGVMPEYYNVASPNNLQKIVLKDIKHSAIMTWHKLNQESIYLEDLGLEKNYFVGKKVLDIGSGPISGATAFVDCDLYLLDPLWLEYIKAGYPTHYFRDKVKIIVCPVENITLEDNSFDAIISLNALDHVDDFHKAALEIRRVLKPTGILRLHLHYHPATMTEPLELNDFIVSKEFKWCENFKKISEATTRRNHTLGVGEKYTIWGN